MLSKWGLLILISKVRPFSLFFLMKQMITPNYFNTSAVLDADFPKK